MNNLMNLYAETCFLVDARQVFDEMPVKNPYSWNMIISACTKQGQIGNAQRVFKQMPKPDSVTWTAIMVGYNQMGRFENFIDMNRLRLLIFHWLCTEQFVRASLLM